MGIYNKEFINRTALNEVYFGETPEVKHLQELLTKLRRKSMEDKLIPKINSSKEILEFNRYCEDMFGFKTFCLAVEQFPGDSAYTYPISNTFKGMQHKKYFAPTTQGMKYKKESNYCTLVYISNGLLNDTKYSDREILAILLHEIGHNFSINYSNIMCLQSALLPLTLIINAINTILYNNDPVQIVQTLVNNVVRSSNTMTALIGKINEYIHHNIKALGIASDTVEKFLNNIRHFNTYIYKKFKNNEIAKFLQEPAKLLLQVYNAIGGGILIAVNPTSLVFPFLNYDNEKLADNFATMYGYGSDLSSALAKMELGKKDERTNLYKKAPVIMQFMNLLQVPSKIALMTLDCHPSTMERMLDQLHYLQKELDKENIDPKIKKEIQKQVDMIEFNLKDYIYNPVKNKDITDPNYMTKCFYVYLQNSCDGDLKNFIMDTDNYANIEKVYKSNLEQVKFI